MPSSISSSDTQHAASEHLERQVAELGRSGWLALAIFLLGMIALEGWARWLGVPEGDYRNSEGAWAEQRRRVDRGEGDAWVFLGSSRVLFNLQTPVWAEIDGREPIQLALEGTSPMTALEGLADDPDFSGKVIVGVAPGLFFSGFQYREGAFERFRYESPSDWLGHKLSVLAEPYLAFYDPDFSLPLVLERQDWPQREGAPSELEVRKLSTMARNRNTRMWSRVENDPEYRDLARYIWAQGWKPMSEWPEERVARHLEQREKQIERAVAAVEKLRARGLPVIFVRMPVTGHYAESEPDAHPRAETWDVLIERTGAIGLHFEDHPEMQGYWLPEWSHMSAAEADRFTAAFHGLVQRELAAYQAQGELP